MKKKERGKVISQTKIGEGIFDMWIQTSLAEYSLPGQFLCLYPRDKSTLLPRPISICEVGEDKASLRIVYRIAGQGTREFSAYGEGEYVEVMGPLGNGFPFREGAGKRVFLIGGGIGIPPLLQLARKMGETENLSVILGYRDNELFLSEELGNYGKVYIATEDGSVGTKGNVIDAMEANDLKGDILFACGPMPMLRAIKAYAVKTGMKAYISLEEHMACGVGACLGCVVAAKETDSHSQVKNKRICTEGPVFDAQEVEIG